MKELLGKTVYLKKKVRENLLPEGGPRESVEPFRISGVTVREGEEHPDVFELTRSLRGCIERPTSEVVFAEDVLEYADQQILAWVTAADSRRRKLENFVLSGCPEPQEKEDPLEILYEVQGYPLVPGGCSGLYNRDQLISTGWTDGEIRKLTKHGHVEPPQPKAPNKD